MKTFKQWIFVNLFFLVVYLAGIGSSIGFGFLLDSLGPGGDLSAYAASGLGVASLFVAYFIGKAIHSRLSGSK